MTYYTRTYKALSTVSVIALFAISSMNLAHAQNQTAFSWGHGSETAKTDQALACLLYTSPSPRDQRGSRMPSSA